MWGSPKNNGHSVNNNARFLEGLPSMFANVTNVSNYGMQNTNFQQLPNRTAAHYQLPRNTDPPPSNHPPFSNHPLPSLNYPQTSNHLPIQQQQYMAQHTNQHLPTQRPVDPITLRYLMLSEPNRSQLTRCIPPTWVKKPKSKSKRDMCTQTPLDFDHFPVDLPVKLGRNRPIDDRNSVIRSTGDCVPLQVPINSTPLRTPIDTRPFQVSIDSNTLVEVKQQSDSVFTYSTIRMPQENPFINAISAPEENPLIKPISEEKPLIKPIKKPITVCKPKHDPDYNPDYKPSVSGLKRKRIPKILKAKMLEEGNNQTKPVEQTGETSVEPLKSAENGEDTASAKQKRHRKSKNHFFYDDLDDSDFEEDSTMETKSEVKAEVRAEVNLHHIKHKKTCAPFLQDAPCDDLNAAKLSRCLECKCIPSEKRKEKLRRKNQIFCRFYGFRKLRYSKSGNLANSGFSEPFNDPVKEHLALWNPPLSHMPSGLDVETSLFLLTEVGDQFCELVRQEFEMLSINLAEDKTLAWKRVVQGVREMCDVCETSIFNYHWSCCRCGFVVCIGCYKRKSSIWTPDKPKIEDLQRTDVSQGAEDIIWMTCKKEPHQVEKLTLTQIIPADCLRQIGDKLHSTRTYWGQKCACRIDITHNFFSDIKPKLENQSMALPQHNGLDFINATIQNHFSAINSGDTFQYKHYVRKIPRKTGPASNPDENMEFARQINVPHIWLCHGRLLMLLDPDNPKNFTAFQHQWKRGQPVLFADVNKRLNQSLWTPQSFSEDFGHIKTDLVDCRDSSTISDELMSRFWEGFNCVGKRLKNSEGNPMILKLKDWPPGDDFSELLPTRFQDLMKVFPMREYTHRTGRLNLASRLPDCFVKPDLGPKMYTAYGSTDYPREGTTNLHLDISDAVNVMVYIGIPIDIDIRKCHNEVLRLLDQDCNCRMTKQRIISENRIPGAIWHIYLARDSDKIRDLLNKVAVEKGVVLEPHHDPIHDQSWYLDSSLRHRLYMEYGVEGFTIIQCLGDAVFIPAGAPHQVKNLHNCIKVAEDFVSPENVSHCFTLTEEFRDLSDQHTNHEDKLQIKNIMYHTVKDSLAVLEKARLSSHINRHDSVRYSY